MVYQIDQISPSEVIVSEIETRNVRGKRVEIVGYPQHLNLAVLDSPIEVFGFIFAIFISNHTGARLGSG